MIQSNLEDLKRFGQEHLLEFVERLEGKPRQELVSQICQLDLQLLQRLAKDKGESQKWGKLDGDGGLASIVKAPPAVRIGSSSNHLDPLRAREIGDSALKGGKIGMILVAGGQGTRLGFDRPKGMFPIGPISGRTLFQMHIDRLLAVMNRYGVSIPLYLMTSQATDLETHAYIDSQQRLGLADDQLRIFCQGTMPAIDAATGRILMSSPSQIAVSPDGHGGLLAAMSNSGCLADARKRGIEHLFYAQVDNPLVEICDPLLIGYHLLATSDMTTQVVQKRFATEKVGNVVSIDGKTAIIEYSDLPDSVAQKRNPDGSLKLWAGNIAVHVISRNFLESVVNDPSGLPFHRALKTVPFVNEAGSTVIPDAPNAIKFERFIFDLLPMARSTLVVEGLAENVFAPVKNADGASADTPRDAKLAISGLHRKWLRSAGADVNEGTIVEIHPAWALDAEEVRKKIKPGARFGSDILLR